MVTELYLADINNSPKSKIDLLGCDIKELANSGIKWNPITPKPNNFNHIFEVLPTALLGTSENMIETKAKLDILAVDIDRWNSNKLRNVSTWLYFRANEQAYLIRDLVYSISWLGNGFNDAYFIDNYAQGNFTIERRGRWERVNFETALNETVPTCGGYFQIDNKGTSDGRVALLQIETPVNNDNQTALNEYWLGMREALQGFDDFNPIVPFSSGRRENNLQPDGTLALNTTNLLRRFRVTVGELVGSGNPTHYVGRYIVLLKQSSTVADTVFLMKYGNRANNTQKTQFRRVFINNTNTSWVNLGEVQIPSGNNRLLAVSDVRNTEIEIWVGRTTAIGVNTVTFTSNPIILIPSRHYLYIKSEEIATTGTSILQFRTHEDNSNSYELRLSTGELLTGVPNPKNFYVPYEGTVLVYASQRNGIANDNPLEVSEITLNYYNRYLSYANRQHRIIKSEC